MILLPVMVIAASHSRIHTVCNAHSPNKLTNEKSLEEKTNETKVQPV